MVEACVVCQMLESYVPLTSLLLARALLWCNFGGSLLSYRLCSSRPFLSVFMFQDSIKASSCLRTSITLENVLCPRTLGEYCGSAAPQCTRMTNPWAEFFKTTAVTLKRRVTGVKGHAFFDSRVSWRGWKL